MKKANMLSLLMMAFFTIGTIAQTSGQRDDLSANAAATTVISWQTESRDLGEIEQGKPVDVYFELTNMGDVPLIITEVKTSCGCTVSEFDKEPIMPNGTSQIKATYNAAAKGAFTKTITVYANTAEGSKMLTLKGVVK